MRYLSYIRGFINKHLIIYKSSKYKRYK